MTSTTLSRSAELLAENVAILSLFSRAPIAPQANPRIPALLKRDAGRLLQFEQEERLTGTLAFISGVSDDPCHVIALCVEELVGGDGVRIVVAINKKTPEAGTGILERIKKGLENIFGHLSRIRNDDYASLEGQVFRAVVDMCEKRILGRIASQRPGAAYSKKGKALFGAVIQQIVNAVLNHGNKKIYKTDIESFESAASLLRQRLARLEACKAEDVVLRIEDVIRAAYRLNKTSDFDKIFSGIGKLARYLECALYLLELSKKKSRLFERTVITTVSLDPALFSRSVKVPAECSLTTCLARCQSGARIIYDARNICSRLQTNPGKKSSDFMSTVKKVLGESRVHAEIQIVSYYELHPAVKRPRVIRSSKDACYLCNLFIQLHGAFYMPRTHGNLYCGWRFLPIRALSEVQIRFNRALESRIRDTIQNIMAAPNPSPILSLNSNESTVFSLSSSMSSLASFGQAVPSFGKELTNILEPASILFTAHTRTKIPTYTTETGLMTILPEFLTSLTSHRPGGAESDARVQLHWLPVDRAAAFYIARPRGFIPLETVKKGVDVDVGNGDGVYLAYGGEVVTVEVFRGAAARR
ncbi:hypothetical protein MFIFM68171_01030 [Madurella fahalii]|uniref:Uncharacterized protein n=1 Tax=Madurella fahalii TaxID=1157608 RepID=A0ABQ0FZ88_9PEZI